VGQYVRDQGKTFIRSVWRGGETKVDQRQRRRKIPLAQKLDCVVPGGGRAHGVFATKKIPERIRDEGVVIDD
jgi:hypothetical protein